MIINIKKYAGTQKESIYIGAMCNAILLSLKSNRLTEQHPYCLLGINKNIDEYLMQLFEDSDLRFEADPEEACNAKVFPCEPGDYNIIDYSEETAVDRELQQAKDIITKVFEELEQEKRKSTRNKSRVL